MPAAKWGRILRPNRQVCDLIHGGPTAKRHAAFLRCKMTQLAQSGHSRHRNILSAIGQERTLTGVWRALKSALMAVVAAACVMACLVSCLTPPLADTFSVTGSVTAATTAIRADFKAR